MPHAPTIKKTVDDISKLFARDIANRASRSGDAEPPHYSNDEMLEVIITCVEGYALQDHHAISEVARQQWYGAGRDEIPKALPAVAPATSALAAAFCNRYMAHAKNHEKNREHFAKTMMEYAYDKSNALEQSRPDSMHNHFAQVYDSVCNAMYQLSAEPCQGAEAHLNPKSLWSLNEHGQRVDGPMIQLIKGIMNYTEGHHGRQPPVLPRGEATKQINDIALASMALLAESNLRLRGGGQVGPGQAPSIYSAEYYRKSDAAKIIRKYKVIEKMQQSWNESSREQATNSGARLLSAMREAIIEGMLAQTKEDLKIRHPHLSDKQLDYAVRLPLSLDPSEMEESTSIASLIRTEVNRAVTTGTIDSLMSDIVDTAESDIHSSLVEWSSSDIFNIVERIMERILQALAWAMDKAPGTDHDHAAKLEDKLTAKASNKLMENAIERVVRYKRAASAYDDESRSAPSGKWHEVSLSDLSQEISNASATVVNKVKERKEHKEQRSGSRESGI